VIHEKKTLDQRLKWQALAEVLSVDVESLLDKVSDPKRRFVYLQRQVSPAMAEYVEKLNIEGVYLRKESRRYYPTGEVSAHVVGITDVDDKGIEGLERMYNDWLTGAPGSKVIRRDAKGRQVEILQTQQGQAAGTLQLTIDQRLQAMAYREIKKAMLYYQATSASAIVIDVETSDILAMVNAPSFNPNDRANIAPHLMRNRVLTDAFEPGSSLKPIAVLAALQFGNVQTRDIIDTSPGWMRVGGSLVKDTRNFGKMSLAEIIQHSSNMGTSKLALSIPKQVLLDTYHNLGLTSDTGSGMPGESSGIFHERQRWSDFEVATLSFGYGISVTAAQLARTYTTLANGGVMKPLNIVRHGQTAAWENDEIRVVSQENAKALLAMMETVTQDEGSGKKARVAGYRVAGKTGTSRKAVAGGYGDEYVNIFVGLAPVSHPKLVTVVLINEPGGDLYHAGDTAAPVFSEIMAGALHLLNVSPDDAALSATQWSRGQGNG
jgi:cell division protein FtsI (penicillin-binding protein 3)